MNETQLPPVKKAEGVTLLQGRSPQDMLLRLGYTDPKGEWHQLDVPFRELIQWFAHLRQITLELKIGPPFAGGKVIEVPMPPVEPPRRGKPPGNS